MRAAVELADRAGIDALSMRVLAEELDVRAMSLYHYVASRADLLAGMLELVMDGAEVATGGRGTASWREAIHTSVLSLHGALESHPWARSLIVSPTGVSPASPARLRFAEGLLRSLREGGFPPNLTHHAYHALNSHIVGTIAREAEYLALNGDSKLADAARDFLRGLPGGDIPYAAEHVAQQVAAGGWGKKSDFEFGLNLILDGLERLRAATLNREARRGKRRAAAG